MMQPARDDQRIVGLMFCGAEAAQEVGRGYGGWPGYPVGQSQVLALHIYRAKSPYPNCPNRCCGKTCGKTTQHNVLTFCLTLLFYHHAYNPFGSSWTFCLHT